MRTKFSFQAVGLFVAILVFSVVWPGGVTVQAQTTGSSTATAGSIAKFLTETKLADGSVAVTADFPVGWIDSVTCDGIRGWAIDANNPIAGMDMHVYIDGKAGQGGRLVASGRTSYAREDVNSLFSTSGNHGFLVDIPALAKDGKNHSVYVYGIDTNGGENRGLGNSGKVFNCSGTGAGTSTVTETTVTDKSSPVGWFDVANGFTLTGWAFDQDNPSVSIDVHFYLDGKAGQGGKLIGYANANKVRADVNDLYKISGDHGFSAVVNTTVTGNVNSGSVTTNATGSLVANVINGGAFSDGKDHTLYAYAMNSNGGINPLINGNPKTLNLGVRVGTTGGTGTVGGGGGGGGGSSRHAYLDPCKGFANGYLDPKVDPIIYGVVSGGKAQVTISLPATESGAKISIDGKATSSLQFEVAVGSRVSVVAKDGSEYIADTIGMKDKDTVSVLVPMPCIVIGYSDILGGQMCGEGQDGTCADELDAFIRADRLTALGFKPGEFKIWYRVNGGDYDTKGWKDYDWEHCGIWADHCIRLKGAGEVQSQTAILTSRGDLSQGNYSLTATRKFDVPKGQF